MSHVDQIALLITSDPDIINEGLIAEGEVRDIIKNGLRRARGHTDSFLRSAHNNLGTKGILDLANDLADNKRPANGLLLKELLLWAGVPAVGIQIAHILSLPWVTGLLFKSLAWFGLVQIIKKAAQKVQKTDEIADVSD